MFHPQRPLASVSISYGRHRPPFAAIGGFILPPSALRGCGRSYTATVRLSRLWEALYRHRPLFTLLYRRHLRQKIETAPPWVVLLSWGTFPVLWVFPIALDAERYVDFKSWHLHMDTCIYM